MAEYSTLTLVVVGVGVALLVSVGTVAATGWTSVVNSDTTAPDCSTVSYNGSGTAQNPYEVETVDQLQCLNQTLDASYELVADIDATGTAEWNGGTGFAPIKNGSSEGFNNPCDSRDGASVGAHGGRTTALERGFAGEFDGNGHIISNLTLDRWRETFVGLLGATTESALVTNVTLANVTVFGDDQVGALVGKAKGTVRSASASGTVTGGNAVGGLVGDVDSSGMVRNTSAAVRVRGCDKVGGLVGDGGSVRGSVAVGNVTGTTAVGGLVGDGATVRASFATGTVTGTRDVGGLVGTSGEGTVRNSNASGRVNGSIGVGGLVGAYNNVGRVIRSTATGSVAGEQSVGGLVGFSQVPLRDSSAAGDVSGASKVGGLVGATTAAGNVTRSNATGNVTYAAGEPVSPPGRIGGLVGRNDAVLNRSSAAGNVTGPAKIGGLVGANTETGTVARTSATGSVNGSTDVGGLVGDSLGAVRRSFAAGRVTGDNRTGGLVGNTSATAATTRSYWDTEATGQDTSVGGTGLETAQMTGPAARTNMTELNFTTTWNTVPDGYPALLGVGPGGPPPAVLDLPPRDLDGDGRYEDVRGDGTVDIFDVQTLFANLDTPVVQDNAQFFNFQGTDATEVTIFDVQALFTKL